MRSAVGALVALTLFGGVAGTNDVTAYRIRHVQTNKTLNADDAHDHLLSTRFQSGLDGYSAFTVLKMDGTMWENGSSFAEQAVRIRVVADNRMLHADDARRGTNVVSTLYQPDDDYNHFFVVDLGDGTVNLKSKASGRFLHVGSAVKPMTCADIHAQPQSMHQATSQPEAENVCKEICEQPGQSCASIAKINPTVCYCAVPNGKPTKDIVYTETASETGAIFKMEKISIKPVTPTPGPVIPTPGPVTPTPGPAPSSTKIYKHKWGTVADVMAMHGKFGSPDDLPPSSSIAFAAANYKMITTGSGCSKKGSISIEDGTLAVAAGIKAKNPDVLVGMYWRTDGALEIAKKGCSNYTAELAKLGTDIFLKDDKGVLINHGSYQWDYTNSGEWAPSVASVLNGIPILTCLFPLCTWNPTTSGS
jgi:hypothetical protein